MRHLLIAMLSLTTACIAELSGGGSSSNGGETSAAKIEGSQIGVEGLVMHLGSRGSVTFHDWVAKPGAKNEFNGFSITITGADSLGYVVKAGTSRYASGSATWTHPKGLDANAISNVDFGDDGGGGGGGGGGGDGGDGCIEGCDDGEGGGDGGGGDGGDGGDGGGGDGGDGCIEGCDDGTPDDGQDNGFGDDSDGLCFEPEGCDGAGGDSPPVTDGGGDEGGAVIL